MELPHLSEHRTQDEFQSCSLLTLYSIFTSITLILINNYPNYDFGKDRNIILANEMINFGVYQKFISDSPMHQGREPVLYIKTKYRLICKSSYTLTIFNKTAFAEFNAKVLCRYITGQRCYEGTI